MKTITFAALLLAASGAAAQDAVTLRWNLTEGRTIPVSWKCRLKMTITSGKEAPPTMDTTFEFGGSLAVRTSGGEKPAECLLTLNRFGMKADQFDVLIENGKETRSLPEGAAGRIKTAIENPFRLTISPRGEYTMDDKSILKSFFGGQGTILGPTLPMEAVTAGSTWKVPMQTLQSKEQKGPVFEITNTVSEITTVQGRRIARIVADEKKEFEHSGMKMEFTVKSQGRFDIEDGVMRSYSVTTTMKGSGTLKGKETSMSGDATIDFEVPSP